MNIYASPTTDFVQKTNHSMPISKLEFDENLPKINVIPQDIGRVLLNLINNAFYAVEPPKGGKQEDQIDYKPEVIVSTSYSPPFGGNEGGENEL